MSDSFDKDWEAKAIRGLIEKKQSSATITGIISQDTYDWAIQAVNLQWHYFKQTENQLEDLEHTRFMIDHARWIIDRVHDGTLALPSVDLS